MFSAKLAKATAVSCTAVAIIAIAPVAAYGAAQPQSVTVVNPTTSPVNARITNTVVPVEVSNADPIPVTVNQAAEEVVQVSMFAITPNLTQEAVCNIYTVPAGKRLVVEYVSLGFNAPTDSLFRATLLVDDGPSHIELIGQKNPTGLFVVSHPVTFYVEAGHRLRMILSFADRAPESSVLECSAVGRLVNVPAP